MSYPGNATLSQEIRQRILTTFEQTLSMAGEGKRQEAMLGCDFILRLDPGGDIGTVDGLEPVVGVGYLGAVIVVHRVHGARDRILDLRMLSECGARERQGRGDEEPRDRWKMPRWTQAPPWATC